MVRGLERRPIFRDDLDQADCLALLAAVVAATGLTVSTWALRPHHAHLLGRIGLWPLAVVVGMQPAAVLKGARRKHGRLPPGGRCWRMIARSFRMQRPFFHSLVAITSLYEGERLSFPAAAIPIQWTL